MHDSEWCYTHNPEQVEKRKTLGVKGGKRGGRGRPLPALADIQSKIDALVEKVLTKELSRGDAAVIGQLLNIKVGCIRATLKAQEQLEIRAEIDELRELFESQQQNRKGQNPWESLTS